MTNVALARNGGGTKYRPSFNEITNTIVSPYLIPGLVGFKSPTDTRGKAEKIIKLLSNYEDMDLEMIKGGIRKREVVSARHKMAGLIKWAIPSISLAKIGEVLGGRDHATIINSIKKCEAYYSTEREWRTRYDYLKGILITNGYVENRDGNNDNR